MASLSSLFESERRHLPCSARVFTLYREKERERGWGRGSKRGGNGEGHGEREGVSRHCEEYAGRECVSLSHSLFLSLPLPPILSLPPSPLLLPLSLPLFPPPTPAPSPLSPSYPRIRTTGAAGKGACSSLTGHGYCRLSNARFRELPKVKEKMERMTGLPCFTLPCPCFSVLSPLHAPLSPLPFCFPFSVLFVYRRETV